MDKRQTAVVTRFLAAADAALATIEGDEDSQDALASFDASYQTVSRERFLPPELLSEAQSLTFAITGMRSAEILAEIAAMKSQPVTPDVPAFMATSLRDANVARQKVASHLADG